MKVLIIFLSFLINTGVYGMFPEEGLKAENNAAVEKSAVIKGKVVDFHNGESLTGAKISIAGKEVSVYSNFEGEFVIEGLPPGKYSIRVEYISYGKSIFRNVHTEEDEITIKLKTEKNLNHQSTNHSLPSA